MESLIEGFAECVAIEATMSPMTGTETKAKESPDKLNSSVARMGKTLTEKKESPDRAFIPKRLL